MKKIIQKILILPIFLFQSRSGNIFIRDYTPDKFLGMVVFFSHRSAIFNNRIFQLDVIIIKKVEKWHYFLSNVKIGFFYEI